MNGADIVLAIIIITCVIFMVLHINKRKKKGGGCAVGCTGCAMRETCMQEKKK